MNDSTETESRFQALLLCNCGPDNKEGHSQNEERGIELATRQQRQDRGRQKQNRSYQKAPLSNYSLHRYPCSAKCFRLSPHILANARSKILAHLVAEYGAFVVESWSSSLGKQFDSMVQVEGRLVASPTTCDTAGRFTGSRSIDI